MDGAALRNLLMKSRAKVSIFAYDPPRFVHAKLVAVIKGKRARLLSGSANLSRAALTSSMSGETWANTEAGVLNDATASEVRDLFQPPGLDPRTLVLPIDSGGDERQRLVLLARSAAAALPNPALCASGLFGFFPLGIGLLKRQIGFMWRGDPLEQGRKGGSHSEPIAFSQ